MLLEVRILTYRVSFGCILHVNVTDLLKTTGIIYLVKGKDCTYQGKNESVQYIFSQLSLFGCAPVDLIWLYLYEG